MTRPPRGFSLADVMAIFFVIGVGLMLWLGFVTTARETSRRSLCVNNLKQIGAALEHYQTTHGCFPLGVTASFNPMSEAMNTGVRTPGVPTDWSGWSPLAQMLVYLDQTALYNAINFDFDPIVNGQEPLGTRQPCLKLVGEIEFERSD